MNHARPLRFYPVYDIILKKFVLFKVLIFLADKNHSQLSKWTEITHPSPTPELSLSDTIRKFFWSLPYLYTDTFRVYLEVSWPRPLNNFHIFFVYDLQDD